MIEQANSERTQRQRWMAVLAKAPRAALEAHLPADLPAHRILRRPETGLVLVRGRAGGRGQSFNFGEMTVTRCAVQLESGIVGHAYVGGRDKRHAELAALVDALLQDAAHAPALLAAVVEPLAAEAAARRERRAREAAATKVEFFTVAREAGQHGGGEAD